jgi:hypothetical protein
MRTLIVFVVATILAYLAIVFGWIAYADFADVADREGGLGMAVVFIIAPICAVLIGIAAALLIGGKSATGRVRLVLVVAGLLLVAWVLLSLLGA